MSAAHAAALPGPDGLRTLHAAMLDAVLTGLALEHVTALAAEHLGATVALVVPAAGVATAWPPRAPATLEPLHRYTLQRLAGEPAPVPAGVTHELAVAARGEQLGLAAVLDTPLGERAADVLHLTAAVAVVALALEEEAGGDGAGRLLEQLLDPAATPSGPEILSRARRAGTDLAAGATACCAPADDVAPHRIEAVIREAFPDALVLRKADRVLALLPGRDVRRLAGRPLAVVPFETDPERFGRALREADLAAGLIADGAASPDEVRHGTHRLLLRLAAEHPDELRRFHDDTIGPLVAYDAEHRTEIAATLRAYLAENCNMNATANAIYAHRHTVSYRLERVRELTALDPFSHEDRERLGLGLKAAALLR